MKRHIFVPGSFSPFHDGHFTLIQNLLADKNNVIEIIMSAKDRDDVNSNIVFEFISEMFKKYDNVLITLTDESPIYYVYQNTIPNKNVIYSMIRSSKDNDDVVVTQYISSFSKNGKFYNDKILVENLDINTDPISYTDSHNNDIISATHIRNDLKDKNYKNFKKGYKILLKENLVSDYKLKKLFNDLTK